MSMGSENKIPRQTSESVPRLPQEIIFNILTRTTVKALTRFRCVSKSWLSTISSPQFIESHLKISSTNRNVILGYSEGPGPVTFYTCSLDHYLMNYKTLEHDNLIKLEFDFDLIGKPPHHFLVVGSCNGLCCIATFHSSLILLNPSTRKLKQIPKPVFGGIDAFGFGYDDSCDDYKIVHFQPWPGKKLVLRVYSLRKNSWSKIETDYSAPFDRQGRAPFVNGKLHWMVKPQKCGWIIMSYDLKTGSIGHLMQPCDGFSVWTFGLYRGHLCLEDSRDIWIMSEYGDDESWKKIASYCPKEGKFLWDLSSIGLGSDGTLDSVFQYQQRYNKNTENYAQLEVAPYIESLVSPSCECDMQEVDKARGSRKTRKGGKGAAESLESLTVERLRKVLREKGLPVKGKKDELIARLRTAN